MDIKGKIVVKTDANIERDLTVDGDTTLNSLSTDKALIVDNTGKVDSSVTTATELSYLSGVTSNVQDQLDDKQNLSEKGQSNGYAPLDINAKVPVANLPNAIMEYQGNWDASTNTPALADGVGNADEDIGDVYRVNVAGTQDLGSGSQTFEVGDYAILNSSKIWEKANTNDDVANRTLSNLNSPTAINQHLIFDIAGFAFVKTKDDTSANSISLDVMTGDSVSPGLNSGSISLGSGTVDDGNTGSNSIYTGDTTSGITGGIDISSGSATSGGTTGDINILTGTTSGQRGKIYQEADGVYLYSIGTSHPTGLDLYSDKWMFITSADKIDVIAGDGKTLLLGTDTSTTLTGDVDIRTGNSPGDTGNIYIQTGTAAGTRGKIVLSGAEVDISGKKIVNASDPTNPQELATKNYVDTTAQPLDTQLTDLAALDYFGNANKVVAVNATATGFELVSPTSGANTTLSNLTSPTAINQTLAPATSGSYHLGTSVKKWGSLFTEGHIYAEPIGGQFTIGTTSTTNTDILAIETNTSGVASGVSSGPILVKTADATGVGADSGGIYLTTGTSSNSNTGDLYLTTGTASGIRGEIVLDSRRIRSSSDIHIESNKELKLYDATNTNYTALKAPTTPTNVTFKLPSADGASGEVIQTNGSGELSFVALPSAGANTTLSNLTSPTAINQDLIFNKAVAEFKTKDDTSADSSPLTIGTGNTVGSAFASGTIILKTGNTSSTYTGDMSIATGDSATGNTGNLTIGTGTPNISGNSGNINITTSTAPGGTRGYIVANANSIVLNPDVSVNILAGKTLKFYDNDDTNYVGLKSPSVLFSDLTFTLPSSYGNNGDVLQSDGAGGLNFVIPTVYADITLSNLTSPTAINQNLIFDKGGVSILQTKDKTTTNTDIIVFNSGNTTGSSFNSGIVNVSSGLVDDGVSGNTLIGTGDAFVSGGATGDISVKTGDVISGTGTSGSLSLSTGTTSGSRGSVTISAKNISITTDDNSVNFNNSLLSNISLPTNLDDAASKSYVDYGKTMPVTTVTSNTTVGAHRVVLVDATSGNKTITLQAASGQDQRMYVIKKIDSSVNTVTIDADASETIDGSLTKVLSSQYDSIAIVCNGTSWYEI